MWVRGSECVDVSVEYADGMSLLTAASQARCMFPSVYNRRLLKKVAGLRHVQVIILHVCAVEDQIQTSVYSST